MDHNSQILRHAEVIYRSRHALGELTFNAGDAVDCALTELNTGHFLTLHDYQQLAKDLEKEMVLQTYAISSLTNGVRRKTEYKGLPGLCDHEILGMFAKTFPDRLNPKVIHKALSK